MESKPMLTARDKFPLLEVQRKVEPAMLHRMGQRAEV